MKSNYSEQVSWYEKTVQRHIITPHYHATRCWYATGKRSPFAAMEEDSLNEFQETEQEQETEKNDTIMFDEAVIMNNLCLNSPAVNEQQAHHSYISPLNRTSSEETIYFDASDHWINNPVDESKEVLPLCNELLAKSILKHSFDLENYIPNQLESILAAMEGKDVFLVLPSGPLRNICYQVPVMASIEQATSPSKTTIVIVSTPTFLQEHYNYCYSNKLSVQMVTKSSTQPGTSWVNQDQLYHQFVHNPDSLPALLYFTYEDFSKSRLTIQSIYQQDRIARFVIDEAHCLSQWGNDFHFGYLRATEKLRPNYPAIPITAMTGIPNQRIHIDIMDSLHIYNTCKIFKKSIFLP